MAARSGMSGVCTRRPAYSGRSRARGALFSVASLRGRFRLPPEARPRRAPRRTRTRSFAMTSRIGIGLSAAAIAACAGLAQAQSFTEGFEDGVFPPADWFIHNQSNPVNPTVQWRLGNVNHSGAGSARDDYNCGAGVSTLSDWLIGRQVAAIQNGDSFSFWTVADGDVFPDRMQARMSLAGASVNTGATESDVGDFSTLLLDINPTYTSGVYPTAAYGQFTVTVSGVPSATAGRFAFRYFVE